MVDHQVVHGISTEMNGSDGWFDRNDSGFNGNNGEVQRTTAQAKNQDVSLYIVLIEEKIRLENYRRWELKNVTFIWKL